MQMKRYLWAVVAVAALGLAGCGSDGNGMGPGPGPGPVEPTSMPVDLNLQNFSLAAAGLMAGEMAGDIVVPASGMLETGNVRFTCAGGCTITIHADGEAMSTHEMVMVELMTTPAVMMGKMVPGYTSYGPGTPDGEAISIMDGGTTMAGNYQLSCAGSDCYVRVVDNMLQVVGGTVTATNFEMVRPTARDDGLIRDVGVKMGTYRIDAGGDVEAGDMKLVCGTGRGGCVVYVDNAGHVYSLINGGMVTRMPTQDAKDRAYMPIAQAILSGNPMMADPMRPMPTTDPDRPTIGSDKVGSDKWPLFRFAEKISYVMADDGMYIMDPGSKTYIPYSKPERYSYDPVDGKYLPNDEGMYIREHDDNNAAPPVYIPYTQPDLYNKITEQVPAVQVMETYVMADDGTYIMDPNSKKYIPYSKPERYSYDPVDGKYLPNDEGMYIRKYDDGNAASPMYIPYTQPDLYTRLNAGSDRLGEEDMVAEMSRPNQFMETMSTTGLGDFMGKEFMGKEYMREMMMDDGTSKKDILTVFSNNPNNEMGATLTTGPDYLAFGFWLEKTNDMLSGIGTFYGGSMPFENNMDDGGMRNSAIALLRGTASYEGMAAGKYARKEGGNLDGAGHFTAMVGLNADFFEKARGEERHHVSIDGSVTKFKDEMGAYIMDANGEEWKLDLLEATTATNSFMGMTTGDGNWQGQFFGPAAARLRRDVAGVPPNPAAERKTYPTGVAGEFTGHFDDGHVIGAFGAELQPPQ